MHEMIALALDEVEKIGIIDPARSAGRHRHPHAEDLSGLLRHLRSLRR